MARLSASERAALPDRAFAYIDSAGVRRLPIADAAHVRNALARFGRVAFESEAARDEARRRLLRAARRFRIVPVGFIDAEVRSVRDAAADGPVPNPPPSGFVTLMLTDIEGSTGLVEALGDRYVELLDGVQRLQSAAVERHGGYVVELRADEAFASFASPADAVRAAIAIQHAVAGETWPSAVAVGVRIGLHAGYPTVRHDNYVGMVVHTAARISDAAHGGQILISSDAKEALSGLALDGVGFRSVGTHRLRGIPEPVALLQIRAAGLSSSFPPIRLAK